ncbi:MAG TPA: hypothetical protein VNT20_04825 [Flavisolibacter sp.]|jgi:hypothetical protein|nr:hypothetical protein [Flavisolibacter sp.]
MTIKGQYKTFGFWFSLASVGGLIALIYWLFIGLGDTPIAGQIFFGFVLFLLICIYGKLLFDANLITVDTTSKTVTFKNVLTQQTSTYHFTDFDGKLVWYEPIKGGQVRNFYFIHERKAIKKISGFIYSNQKELEEALVDIKEFRNHKLFVLEVLESIFRLSNYRMTRQQATSGLALCRRTERNYSALPKHRH